MGARKYWYAPRLVLFKTASGKLSIAGFILTRKDDGSDKVYTAASHPPTTYLLAKFHLTAADNQVHQFVSHLGMTHLLAEPFIVAAHNALPDDHLLSALLHPHFIDTIGINFLARQTLVSSVAPLTDSTFSVGTRLPRPTLPSPRVIRRRSARFRPTSPASPRRLASATRSWRWPASSPIRTCRQSTCRCRLTFSRVGTLCLFAGVHGVPSGSVCEVA